MPLLCSQRHLNRKTVSKINELLNFPGINLEVNSVFTPLTVSYLLESIKFIMDMGVSQIHFTNSTLESWDRVSLLKLENEMQKLREITLTHCKRRGNIPVMNFREHHGKGIFYCTAGEERLAIAPEGAIWGCFLFPDYFKEKEKFRRELNKISKKVR